jgi:hypothetical protein
MDRARKEMPKVGSITYLQSLLHLSRVKSYEADRHVIRYGTRSGRACSVQSSRTYRLTLCRYRLTGHSVSGPVVIGERMRGCAMYELVRVGHAELVGGGLSSLLL